MMYVGLSGGIDSMVLLHKMCVEYGSQNITAIHVNHHISSNSKNWENFCREYCETHNIGFIVKPVNLTSNTEDEARKHRYNAYRECCSEIYLAHHADDDVETMLFKMIRGCGLGGLKGMTSNITYGGLTVHRPLLKITKAEIHAYATTHNLQWVTDESNHSDVYSRNFLRNQIIPSIKERFPMCVTSMIRLKENITEADDLTTEIAVSDMHVTQMILKQVLTLTPLRRRNLVRHYIKTTVGNLPPANQFNEFIRQLETSTNGKKPKINVGTVIIGIQDKKIGVIV